MSALFTLDIHDVLEVFDNRESKSLSSQVQIGTLVTSANKNV